MFQAWLVKMANTAAISAPSIRPGASDMKKTTVTEAEWEGLRAQLRHEAARWLVTLRTPREVAPLELHGMVGSIAHLAYHLGAIRQINSNARGPAEGERS